MTQTVRPRLHSSNQPLLIGCCLLLIAQLLFLTGVGFPYALVLIYVLTIGLPYPKIFSSFISRAIVAVLLSFSLVQLSAIIQFFFLPQTKYEALCLITTIIAIILVLSLRNIPREPMARWSREDTAGMVAAAFFALPLGAVCFWGNDLGRIASFASLQGSDGGSHYTLVSQSSNIQHIGYREAQYYPEGFHLASAFMLHTLQLNQHDQDWTTNARVYVGMYIAWSALMSFTLCYLALQLRSVLPLRRRPPPLLIALGLGPVLAGLYLSVLTMEGFLSFFYICIALAVGAIYVLTADLNTALGRWQIAAYLLLGLGVAMSWGPLLTPVVLCIPLLYLLQFTKGPLPLVRLLLSPSWRWILAAFLLHSIPLYLHLRYATLTEAQGVNASGALNEFHYGIVIGAIALITYLLCARVPETWRTFTGNILLPLLLLSGAFAVFQLLSVGEVRYYSIKISYVFEVILLAAAVTVLAAALWQKLPLHSWIALPLIIGLGATLLAGITANPLSNARALLDPVHTPTNTDVPHFVQLGQSGQLSMNSVSLHRNPTVDRLTGYAVLTNWTHLMQYSNDNTPAIADCNGRIFALQAHQPDLDRHDEKLLQAVEDCITAAQAMGKPYFILTDTATAPELKAAFGDSARYLY